MRTHPTFYVGRSRPYYQHEASSENGDSRHAQESPTDSCDNGTNTQVGSSATLSCDEPPLARRANGASRVRSQAERTRITIGLSPDRYGDVVRSTANLVDDRTRN